MARIPATDTSSKELQNMKQTTARNGATGTIPECSRSRKWSCTSGKAGISISDSGDFYISRQRECRKHGGTEEPTNDPSPSVGNDHDTAVRRTPLKSIRKRCLDCTGGEMGAVRKCELDNCDLHPFRMGHGRGSKLKTIRQHCLSCMNKQIMEVSNCPTSSCPLFIYRFGYGPRDARHSQKYALPASIPDGTDRGDTLTATLASEEPRGNQS